MSTTNTFLRSVALGTAAATALAVAPAVAPSLAPQAAAAPVQAQQTYNCAITVDENPGETSYMDLTANIELDLPDQVAPGDQVSVSGHFSVQLPAEMAALFGAYFPSAHVTSDGVTLPLNIGGQDQLVGTSYIDSGTIDTRNPPVVFGGSFTTDPVTVPEGSAGEVSFSMPRNDSVPAISGGGMAAFTAVLVAQGGIVPGYEKGTDRVSCSSPSGESALIGSVPLSGDTAGAAGGGAATGAVPGAAPGAPSSGAAPAAGGNRIQAAQAAGAPAAAEEAEGEDGAPAPDPASGVPAAAAPGVGVEDLAEQIRLSSMQQAASRDDGVYLPMSVLGWGTLGIVLAAVLFTVATNARTRRLEDAANDY